MLFLSADAGNLLWLLNAIALIALLFALWTAPWKALIVASARQHLFLGAIFILTFLWGYIYFTLDSRLIFHPLLMTSCALILGSSLTLFVGALALLFATLLGGFTPEFLGINFIVGVITPVLSTHALLKLITASRIKNLFLYTLGAGFGGGMLSIIAVASCSLAISALIDPSLFTLNWENASLYFLLMFPEGFMNGAIVSSLAVMRPELVRTYDDDFYLSRDD